MLPTIERLYFSPAHNYFGHHGRAASEHPSLSATELRCVAGRGIDGDRFFDYRPDYPGQITFFSAETFDELCRELAVREPTPAALRRNVVIRGLDLPALVEREFSVQGLRFFGASECKPCHWMNDAIAPGAEEWLRGRGGLRARILAGGTLHVGPADFCLGSRGSRADIQPSPKSTANPP